MKMSETAVITQRVLGTKRPSTCRLKGGKILNVNAPKEGKVECNAAIIGGDLILCGK